MRSTDFPFAVMPQRLQRGGPSFADRARAVAKGATFAFNDEIEGGLRALMQLDPAAYEREVARIRAQQKAYEEGNPYESAGLEIGGAFLPALLPGGQGLAGARVAALAAKAPRAARIAPVVGEAALYGVGAADSAADIPRSVLSEGAQALGMYGLGAAAGPRLKALGAAAGPRLKAFGAKAAARLRPSKATAPSSPRVKPQETPAEAPLAVRPSGITAYHGSPHSFDRFDMSKIGTGEGAQSYGHGLYFAENEATARSYRDALSPKKVEVDGVALPDNVQRRLADAINRFPTVDSYLAPMTVALDRRKKELAQAVKAGDELTANILSADVNDFQGVLDALAPHRGKAFDRVPDGSMYQVRIDADPADFLDYDAPFGQQPQKVRDAIRYAFGPQPEDAMIGGGTMDKPREMHTRLLKDKGIPGIKYLDQGSRAAGDGSRNYVVFDDKLITILKKYGWMPGMAIPAAAMEEYKAEQELARGGLAVKRKGC